MAVIKVVAFGNVIIGAVGTVDRCRRSGSVKVAEPIHPPVALGLEQGYRRRVSRYGGQKNNHRAQNAACIHLERHGDLRAQKRDKAKTAVPSRKIAVVVGSGTALTLA